MNEIKTTNLVNEIKELLSDAKRYVRTSINIAMVYAYYEIGRRIVEEEQKGKNRAGYGEELIRELSRELTKECGKGYSVSSLKTIRQFYVIYSEKQIHQSVIGESKNNNIFTEHNFANFEQKFNLSWTHYIRLIRISDPDERRFYEIEAYKNNWSVRELTRQYNSALYQRLVLSKNKKRVKELSTKGQVVEKPEDAIKDPLILEFLNLKEDECYSEKDLETRIINKLHYFILELGKGFTFCKRQMRLSFGEKNFYIDLVFYNRILRCFVLIDLKIGEIKPQDIGQMQLYVNYFDRYEKLEEENKTIGILLCRDKDDALVRLTLPEGNNQIFASKYETVLPSKEELKKLIEEK